MRRTPAGQASNRDRSREKSGRSANRTRFPEGDRNHGRCEAGHHESGRQFYGKDLELSLDLVARRELERLLGPTASLDQIIRDALASSAAADGALAPAPAPRRRTRAAKA